MSFKYPFPWLWCFPKSIFSSGELATWRTGGQRLFDTVFRPKRERTKKVIKSHRTQIVFSYSLFLESSAHGMDIVIQPKSCRLKPLYTHSSAIKLSSLQSSHLNSASVFLSLMFIQCLFSFYMTVPCLNVSFSNTEMGTSPALLVSLGLTLIIIMTPSRC